MFRRPYARHNRGRVSTGLVTPAPSPPAAPTETIVDTLLPGDDSPWTAPMSGPGHVICWGAGQNGETNTGAGDGAYCCHSAVTFVAEQTYPFSIGTAGDNEGDPGGDTSWNSGEIVAPGGASVTSPVGDTQNAGGAGQTGTGNQNGGGSGGTSAATTANDGGAPNGAQGGSSAVSGFTNTWGAGGSSTASVGNDGGAGAIVVAYDRPPEAGFPYQVGMAHHRDDADTATRNAILPPGEDGVMYEAIIAVDDTATVGMTGWTEVFQVTNSNEVKLAVFVREYTGSDPVEITTSVAQKTHVVVIAWKDADAANVEADTASATTADPDPPSHTPSGGEGDYVIQPIFAMEGLGQMHLNAFPTGYTGRNFFPARDANSPRLAFCHAKLNGTTFNPPAWDAEANTTREHVVATVSIPYGGS